MVPPLHFKGGIDKMRWLICQRVWSSDSNLSSPFSYSYALSWTTHSPFPVSLLVPQPRLPIPPSSPNVQIRYVLSDSSQGNFLWKSDFYIKEGKSKVQEVRARCSQEEVIASCLLRSLPSHLQGKLPLLQNSAESHLFWEDVLGTCRRKLCPPSIFRFFCQCLKNCSMLSIIIALPMRSPPRISSFERQRHALLFLSPVQTRAQKKDIQ